MKIIVVDNYNELSKTATDYVLAQVWEKPNSVLGLATGSTPVGLYKELVKAYQAERVNFSRVKTFNLDEYFGLGAQHKQSYAYFMQKRLFGETNFKSENINIPQGNTLNKEVSGYCKNYEQQISKAGGIDLQILGLGQNGHIGFNEPGSSFNSLTRLVDLSSNTIKANARFFSHLNEVPKQAITMGLETIFKSKKIIVLISGENKALAAARLIEGSLDKKNPSSILKLHNDVVVIIDKAAASKLKKNYSSPLSLVDKKFKVYTPDDLPNNKTIFVISPHPDDASISLGAIISALSRKNKVYTIIMTTGYRSFIEDKDKEQRIKIREDEVIEEGIILGAKPIFLHADFYDAKDLDSAITRDTKKFKKIREEYKPDIIFIPHSKDQHPTHQASRKVVLNTQPTFSWLADSKTEFWEYEGPWAIFNENDFNTIFAFSHDVMNVKIKAIQSQHSQVSRTRFDVAAETLAKLRGALIPEQSLAGFGKKGPRIGEYFELFKVTFK